MKINKLLPQILLVIFVFTLTLDVEAQRKKRIPRKGNRNK